jgi:hypothetical protein
MMMRIAMLVATIASAAVAVAADPQLSQMIPQGGQRGTQVEVELRGARVGLEPQSVMLFEPGLVFEGLERIDDNRVKAKLTIADDCRVGRHAMRLHTASGVSTLATFHVGVLPEIAEIEPNSDWQSPQTIEVGCVVSGTVDREDVDFFAVELAAGERLAIEVEGLRLGRTFFDPTLRILNADRFELAASDDETITYQDSYCVIVAPTAGRYVIELRESAYRGDGNCGYRLHVGRFPRPAAAYPPAGRVGEQLEVTWLGDERAPWKQTVSLPGQPNDKFELFAQDDSGMAPTPNLVRVTNLPVTLEAEPNNDRNTATLGEAPGVFVGVLGEPGDNDYFRFSAKAGQRLNVQSFARELRSPLDAVVRVLKADGARLAGNDDNRGHPDSFSQFNVPEDGEYLIEIEDHLGRGGETFVYGIQVVPESPRVDLVLAEQRRYVATTIDVPVANRTAALLEVRRSGVGGDLQVDWRNLPEGVTVDCPVVPSSEGRVPVVFSAAGDAKLSGAYVELAATKVEGTEAVDARFEQESILVRGGNNITVWNHLADRATVVTTKELPFKLTLVEPQAPLVQRGVKHLKVVAERQEGFEGAILVKMLYNPSGISSNASLRIKQKENEVLIPLTASDNAPARTWPIVMVGEADIAGRVVSSTQIAQLTVAEPYQRMTLPRVAVEQGNSVEFPIEIEQLKPFEGAATVTLEGLPPGVKVEPQQIDASTTKLVYQLDVAKDARPGIQKRLFCRVIFTESGEQVEQMMGDGELRIDEPLQQPAPEATAQTGK